MPNPRDNRHKEINFMFKQILLGAAMLFTVSAFAQQSQSAAEVDPKASTPTAEQLAMADQLVRYGYQTKTALPLIQAVQIYKALNVTPATSGEAKASEGTPAESTSLTKTDVISYDEAKLLEDATTFAAGNKNLLALIADAKKATRGAVGGPIYRIDKVNARTTDIWRFNFRGGEDAWVTVSGDGDTDLDLYIYDENGNLIDSDTDSTDQCICTFRPRWTGQFVIKIKNLGYVYNRYVLRSN